MIYIFLGPPASGKGTQAQLLAKIAELPYISTGERFREEAKTDPELATVLQSGHLVHDDKVFSLYDHLRRDYSDNFVCDGGVRTVAQVDAFLERWPNATIIPVYITLSDEIIAQRAFHRRAVEHQGREDDHPDAVSRRIAIYHDTIDAIIDRFNERGYAVVTINGDQSRETIHQAILEKVGYYDASTKN